MTMIYIVSILQYYVYAHTTTYYIYIPHLPSRQFPNCWEVPGPMPAMGCTPRPRLLASAKGNSFPPIVGWFVSENHPNRNG